MEQEYCVSKAESDAALAKENAELRATVNELGQALALLVSEMLEKEQINPDLGHTVLDKGNLRKYLDVHFQSQALPKAPATEKNYPNIIS